MSYVASNISFHGLRKFTFEFLKTAEEFGEAVRRFGREPGDGWHEIEDLYRAGLAELSALAAELKPKTSLPAEQKAQAVKRAGRLALRLDALVHDLRLSMARACPAEAELTAPDAESAEVWKKYDSALARVADLPLERVFLQRLLRRAHDPGAVITIALPKGGVFTGPPHYYDYYGILRDLAYTTPLPRFDGLTLRALKRERLPAGIEKDSAGARLFARFLDGVLSPSAQVRKAARGELKRIVHLSWEEEHGNRIVDGFPVSRTLCGFWHCFKLELQSPDPLRRRAAMCALPELRFSLITKIFRADCLRVTLRALLDPDGVVRYKTYRFASDLILVSRIDCPALVSELLGQLDALRHDSTAPAVSRQLARKLIRDIDCWRRYDERRGAAPEY